MISSPQVCEPGTLGRLGLLCCAPDAMNVTYVRDRAQGMPLAPLARATGAGLKLSLRLKHPQRAADHNLARTPPH